MLNLSTFFSDWVLKAAHAGSKVYEAVYAFDEAFWVDTLTLQSFKLYNTIDETFVEYYQ